MIRCAPSLAFLLAATMALPALAQAPAVRVRGTVESVSGSALVVKSREGKDVSVALAEGWTISGLRKATMADIKPGTFVGVASAPGGTGPLRALEVLVFPAGMKPGEGHREWDLLPESTMTNATVASNVESVSGPVLTLTYPGGEQKIAVGPDSPIVTFAPAEKSDLKPGAPVFVFAERKPDGALTASRITVGNNGVAPPM